MLHRVLLAALLAVAAPAHAANIVLKAGHTNAAGEPQDQGLKILKAKLEEYSQGKATIEIYANGVLGNELQLIEGVALGTIDMVVPSNAAFTNFVQEMRVFDMPFLFNDMAHMDKVVSGPAFEALKVPAQKKGFHLLGIYSSGVRHIMTREPITRIEDLKGRKIRTMQNPIHLEAFKAFGANATPMAYNELYGALQTGVVDGAEAANTNYSAQKFYEVAKNWALVGWLNLTAPVVISEKKFQSLPPDIQAALVKAGLESATEERKIVVATDQPLLDGVKSKGVNVTLPDPAPFRAAAQPVYAKFLTSDLDKKILSLIESAK
jgi:TRAP-type transport system periplasmic protein